MRLILRLFMTLLGVIGLNFTLTAQSRQKEADDLHRSLRPGMTATDSIGTLYDVFDLSDQDRKQQIGWEMLGVAERAKNYEVLYDMIPVMSAESILKPEEQTRLLEVAERLPDGIEKKAVETFIQVTIATREGSYITPEERHKKLLEYIKEDIDVKDDTYQNFLDLYRVVVYLGLSQNGNMYAEYLERLENMLDELPDEGVQFSSRLYTTAANYYTRNGHPDKAVQMDRKLLKFIAKREKENLKQGRRFRNYDRYKYLCYLRMLSNYKALKPAEVEEYYQKCLELAQKDEEINDHFTKNKQVDAYHLMATGKYADAIPIIEDAIANVKSRSTKYILIDMLKEAAERTGNKEVMVESLKDYTDMLESRLAANSEGAMQELQIRYEIRKIEEEKEQALLEKQEVELSSDNKMIAAALIVLFILTIIVMVLGKKHMRLRVENRIDKEHNENLKREIEELEYNGVIPGTEDLHPIDPSERKNEK